MPGNIQYFSRKSQRITLPKSIRDLQPPPIYYCMTTIIQYDDRNMIHSATGSGFRVPSSDMLDRTALDALCRQAGADDVRFVDVDRPSLESQRDGILRAFPWARTFMVFARWLNSHPICSKIRSISSAEFQECEPFKNICPGDETP